jgi:phenylpropionate dioxygenase-like ring-hydroxylating dioxygenase large terminal subunit
MSLDHLRLNDRIDRQRPGWSLERAFYTCPEIYEFERRTWLAEQWYILGHASEVPRAGDFIVRELLGESLIVARDGSGALRGFFNLCRHRGSRICDRDGHAPGGFTCPYHAWSYRLDGTLRSAAALPAGLDKRRLGLHAVPIEEIGGLIFGTVKGTSSDLDTLREAAVPILLYYGIADARIAARRNYLTRGNWKLVIENFIECYHCIPCHPEFCSVMKFVDVVARQPTAEAADEWYQAVDRWFHERADPDNPVKQVQANPLEQVSEVGVMRGPIGGEYETQSQDGHPIGPLMGKQRRFDGGNCGFRREPFIYFSALNDHAVMFQFLPINAESTDVIVSWLVNGTARENDVDIDRMVWLWDVTTKQDKTIIERNAAGVRSLAYSPGPYSTLESWPARFVARYLRELSTR